MKTKRIEFLDIARGMGMLAVIWGHIQIKGISNTLVYAFDIPLFFFLSGMMYKNYEYVTLNKLIQRLTKKLIIPYFIFSCVTWIVWFLPKLYFGLHTGNFEIKYYLLPLLETFIAQGSGGYLIHNVPLWFVTCLFIVNIMYFYISKLNDKLIICCSVIFSCIGSWMVNSSLSYIFVKLPWNIEVAFSALLFFALGNILTKKYGVNFFDKVYKKMNIIIVLLLVFIYVIGALWNGHVSLGSNMLGKSTLVFYVIGFTGIILIIYISKMLSAYKSNIVVKGIQFIGNESFNFMALHVAIYQLIIIFESKIIELLNINLNSNYEIYLYIVYYFIVIFLTSYVIKIMKYLNINLR